MVFTKNASKILVFKTNSRMVLLFSLLDEWFACDGDSTFSLFVELHIKLPVSTNLYTSFMVYMLASRAWRHVSILIKIFTKFIFSWTIN